MSLIQLIDLVLLHAGLGNLSAIFLFPLLMYYFKLGVTGAAISTVMSQYVLCAVIFFFSYLTFFFNNNHTKSFMF